VLGSNFSRDTEYPEYFGGFPQSLQANAGKGTLNQALADFFHMIFNSLLTVIKSFDVTYS
jgi:hypothetical protein